MGRRGGRPSLNFSGPFAGKCVHAAPKKGPPFLDTRARMSRENSGTEQGCQLTCRAVSPKIPRAKALVRFSRYRAAQEAAPYKEGLKLDKQTVSFLPRFVSDAG